MEKPTKAEVEAMVVKIIAEQLDIPQSEITDEGNLSVDGNLWCDALDQSEIIMTCEEQFGFEMDQDTADEANTVGKLKALCVKLTGAKD
jgi:acyl carrier protein